MAFQTVTASTATTLKPGVYIIAQPASNLLWTLGAPTDGARVTIFADTGSTKDIAFQGNSSAHTFHGSTANKATLTTGVGGVKIELTGLSTSVWAMAYSRAIGSTKVGVTLAASTKVA